MVKGTMNGSSHENAKVDSGLAGFIPDVALGPKSAWECVIAAKRKETEDTTDVSERAPASKRIKPTEHRHASSSSKMDSMAAIGTPSSRHSQMGNGAKNASSSPTSAEKKDNNTDTIPSGPLVSQLIEIPSLPKKFDPLLPLTNAERKELESYLEFNREENWREDWMGSLCFVDKEIANPDRKSRERGRKALFYWATKGEKSLKLLNNLVRYVYNLDDVPRQAKIILANTDTKSARSVQEAVRRVSYDPDVLEHDGWMTIKSEASIGASGGPFRIGERVIWQGSEGVVIAYVHDSDIGDLWKAVMIEELDTFDLEAEELEEGRRRFDRRMQMTKKQEAQPPGLAASAKQEPSLERRTGRNAQSEFYVRGVEHGIVLAVSYGKGARPGVFWPARLRHFSELQLHGPQKRLAMKNRVDVVFLAPYWNTEDDRARSESYSDLLQRHGGSIFASMPLFEVESIDVSTDSIIEYPYEPQRGLDIDELSTSFRFNGLPKAVFSRFVQSHRLALALKAYSQNVMQSTAASEIDKTTANLFEAHALAGQTAHFPPEVLNLPYTYILSQLPVVEYNGNMAHKEPVLQLGAILESMKPPTSWGQGHTLTVKVQEAASESGALAKPFGSPSSSHMKIDTSSNGDSVSFDQFLAGLESLTNVLQNESEPMSILLTQNLRTLLSNVPHGSNELAMLSQEDRHSRLKVLVKLWIIVKTHGDELIASYNAQTAAACLSDWRQACERIYKFMTVLLSHDGFGNAISWVVSDSRCNLHLTSAECFERAVRLPAAMRAAKDVAATYSSRLKIMHSVRDEYLEMAEKEVIRRAHSRSYLRRMKKKCQSVAAEGEIVPLTADSDNKGGEDTKGTKGSWTAAIAAVAASVQAVDMVMNGECVNAFCLTRPPGHHAGRELHALKAVSNGFCLLNSAACAALYATAPVSEGGPGLRRVCVIDIDVHHGNGTQDILCSTYDPRFLYVSLHAGGADINGVDLSGEDDNQFSHHLARTPKKGIFPGRCGDYSPHQGVLNIPLGPRVTSHAVGAALMNRVTPAVERFSPELIVVSAGFDAHKNDPLNLGGLNAEDFGTLTEVICKLAHKSCSGRVVSILEGGYGVPCCRLPANVFDPEAAKKRTEVVSIDTQNGQVARKPAIEEEMTLPDSDVRLKADSLTQEKSEFPPEYTFGAVSTTKISEETTVLPIPPLGAKPEPPLKPLEILDLGDDLPENMKDDMPYALMKRLDKCHAEGFLDCVREHIAALAKCNVRK